MRKADYAVPQWCHVIATLATMQIKDRAKSIKSGSACDNSAKANGKALLYFRSNEQRGHPEDCDGVDQAW